MATTLFPRDDQDANQGPHLRDITTTLLVLAAAFVALRFAARWKRGVHLGWDDYMIVVSLVSLHVNFKAASSGRPGNLYQQLFCFGAGGLNYASMQTLVFAFRLE
jgi:hypothetical protein